MFPNLQENIFIIFFNLKEHEILKKKVNYFLRESYPWVQILLQGGIRVEGIKEAYITQLRLIVWVPKGFGTVLLTGWVYYSQGRASTTSVLKPWFH
jgi:hypothetical protein